MAGGAPGPAGASANHCKRKAPPPAAATEDDEEAEEEDIEEMEREVADLERRVHEHLRRIAPRLPDAVVSQLAALRPPASLEAPSVYEASIAEVDQEKLEKLKILKSKIEANHATLQKVLERMNESIAQCEKLENFKFNIDPAFRSKW